VRRVLELPAYRRLLFVYTANELAWLVGPAHARRLRLPPDRGAVGTTAFFLCSQFAPALVSPLVVARLDQRAGRLVLTVLFAVQSGAALALG
jgi:hypothetical protein